MSTTNQTPEAVLLAEVAVPAFFEKLASETGLSPSDTANAASLLGTGNLITNTIDLYLKKEAAAKQAQETGVVKAATDAAFRQAGLITAQQPATKAASYLETAGVRDAALLLLQAAEKAASVPEIVTPETTEEDDKKKKDVISVPKI